MAKQTAPAFDYSSAIKKLNSAGPARLYILYGEEDYLRELYIEQLRKIILPEGDDGFSYKLIRSPAPDINELYSALDTMPFLNDRILLEVRDIDMNKYPEPEELIKCLSGIPDYATAIFVLDPDKAPDKRLKLYKSLSAKGELINFTKQPQQLLVSWIGKRFKSYGKIISPALAQTLIFMSGDSMSGLIPEIDKVAAYAQSNEISAEDISRAAHHIPEADVFAMIEKLCEGDVKTSAGLLQELLSSKTEPIMINALFSSQLKKMYTAKLASMSRKGYTYLMETGVAKFDFIAKKLMASVSKASAESLAGLVSVCAEADYQMKSSSIVSPEEILTEVFGRIAAGLREKI